MRSDTCSVARCKNEIELYLGDKGLCQKHWAEHCDRTEYAPINKTKKKGQMGLGDYDD